MAKLLSVSHVNTISGRGISAVLLMARNRLLLRCAAVMIIAVMCYDVCCFQA